MKKQDGFSGVEGLLVLLVVVVVGFGGYYVASQQDDVPVDNVVITSQQRTNDSTDADDGDSPRSAEWKLVTSGQDGFSARIPDGWKMLNIIDSDWFYIPGAESTVFSEDNDAEVEEIEGFGTDGRSRFSIVQFSSTDDFSYLNGTEENKGSIIAANTKGTVYYEAPKSSEELGDGIGPQPGAEYYTFEFKDNTTTTYVTYSRQTGVTEQEPNKDGGFNTVVYEEEEDILDLVKELIATLTIN